MIHYVICILLDVLVASSQRGFGVGDGVLIVQLSMA